MHTFMMHTLVDISKNGNLRNTFPFETPAGDVIEDKATLRIARNQESNFNTMIQMLQIRGNITWEDDPVRFTHDLSMTKFGSLLRGTQTPHGTSLSSQSRLMCSGIKMLPRSN